MKKATSSEMAFESGASSPETSGEPETLIYFAFDSKTHLIKKSHFK